MGDAVAAGDLLCRFDDESAQLNLQNAQASLGSMQESYNSTVANYGGSDFPLLQEQLHTAENNYEASKALMDMGAGSQAELDQAYQALLSARAALEAAQASLSATRTNIQSAQIGVETAQYQLSLYSITAPISGVVEAVNLTEHNYSSAGNVAFVISNGSNKTVTFYVTNQVRQQLEQGQSVTVSYDGSEYDGIITEIGGVVDAPAGLFQVKAIIENAQALPDGLSVSITTVTRQENNAVLVSSDALYFENGSSFVYVLQDDHAVQTEVTVGLYTDTQAAITAGLSDGDMVITSWSSRLKDGTPVRTVTAEEAAQGSAQTAE